LNKQPPNIRFKKKDKGGINLQMPVTQTKGVDLAVVTSILKEYRISCADMVLRQDCSVDEIIDVIESGMGQAGKRAYIPCIYVLNKIDSITIEELDLIDQLPHNVPISAKDDWNFEDMLDLIWVYARMLRIYTKPKGQIPDYTAPVVLHADKPSMEVQSLIPHTHTSYTHTLILIHSFTHTLIHSYTHTLIHSYIPYTMYTIHQFFCNRIHRGILNSFNYAWVWGTSVRHQPMKVGRSHILEDEDVVQIVKK
jgi:ribosome-interacting GTPase 1